VKYGYPGRVHAVNPRRDSVAGQRCYPTPRDLPEVPDLAILAVSAAAALPAVQGCVEAGIRAGVLWAGGFAETGEEGAALQRDLAAYCREAGFALCGPNTLGIIDTHLPLAASFATPLLKVDRLVPGGIAMLSQSGGTAIGAFTAAQEAGFGFRCMISSGNEAVLTFPDYLRLLAGDPATKVIACYIEGVRDGADFLDALATVRDSGKPLVMLKVGAGEAAIRAAAAHTGALTGEHRVWQAVLREHGAILVRSQRELTDVCLMLSGADAARLPRGRRVAVAAADPATLRIAAGLLRREGLDPVPTEPASLAGLAADDAVTGVLLDASLQAAPDAAALGALGALRRAGKLVTAAAELDAATRHALAAEGVHVAEAPEHAAEAMACILLRHEVAASRAAPKPLAFHWPRFVPAPRAGLVVSEHDCHRILAAAGLPVARGELVASAEAAAAAALAVGLPVAMKGISPAVTHRAAAGLLLLGVADEAAAAEGYRTLASRAAARDVALEGVYVQHMERGTTEVIVAASRDPMLGVIVTVGVGGTATELLDDVTIARAPFDEAEAAALIGRLRLAAALGAEGPDPAPLAAFVARFSRLAASIPWRGFALEVNPVKWRARRAVAVDGLLVITTV
jgi:acyl-CoA synthetase (NDP forming)